MLSYFDVKPSKKHKYFYAKYRSSQIEISLEWKETNLPFLMKSDNKIQSTMEAKWFIILFGRNQITTNISDYLFLHYSDKLGSKEKWYNSSSYLRARGSAVSR